MWLANDFTFKTGSEPWNRTDLSSLVICWCIRELLLLLASRARQMLFMGGGGRWQMPQRDEEFHQVVTILEHIRYDDGVTKVLLSFYCHFGQKRSRCSAVSFPLPQWWHIGNGICPIRAWYEAVEITLLSLNWWIALCVRECSHLVTDAIRRCLL